MDTTIDQQVAMDEALVPHAWRLRIVRSNFRLLLDIYSKESNLQLVYDVLPTVHHHFIRFKMENKKHIINLESFREMLHTYPRLPGQSFVEPPFEEEILAFLRFLGHSGAIRRLTDAQIIWGLYHKRNVDFAYLMWEDFVYQVEHKDTKKSNEMYYPRFTKVIIHHFMSKDPSIPRRNKVNWHYVRDYHMFTTIKLVAMTEVQQLKLATKRSLQQTHISQASGFGADEGTGSIPGVLDVPTDESEEEISWNFIDEEGDDDNDDEGDDGDDGEEGNNNDAQDDDDQEDEGNDEDDQEEDSDDEQASNEEEFIHLSLSTHAEEETRDEESFDPIPKTPKNSNDEGNGEENMGMNVGREEGQDEEDEEDELYKDVNINLGRGIQMGDVHTTQEFEDSHGTLTSVNPDGQQQSSSVSSQFVTSMLNSTPDAGIESIFETTSQMDFAGAVSSILGIVHRYMDQQMNEAVKVAIQLQSDRLRDEAQKENDEFLKTIDENMQKIIKEQVKEQVKVQVSKILPKIEQTVNEQLEAEVLIRSSNSSKTSYAVAANLSEMELKKILIEKIEGNKSIHRSNKQRNLYKPLVEAYESNKIILDTYEDTVTEGKEPESASAPKEKATMSASKSTQGSKSRQKSASESATAEEPMQTTFEMEEPSHPEFETGADDQPIVEPSQHPEWFPQQKKPPTPYRDWNKTLSATHGSIQPWISDLAKLSESRSSFNKLMDTPMDFSAFLITRLKVDTLTPKLLAGPTYELIKGSCKSLQYPHNLLKPLPLIPNSRGRRVIPFDHFINNDLEYLRGRASSRKYTTLVTKTKAADYGHIKWIEDLVPRTMWIQEPRRIIVVTELKIVEWHNYKHLDWITVRRNDDNLYKFKEGDFKRLHIQDIKDMLLFLVQGKLTNLTVEERTKPDTYRSNLKHKEAYIAYSNSRGFVYQNKDKQNRLMRIDELHKFSNGTLTDVRTTLDDRLKGIRMKYLPQSIWRKSDKR
nr:hypothetical protein [Tanacetum cinerariifolium]